MTILDIFSWLPAKEISLEQIENIVRDIHNGKIHEGYSVEYQLPTDANKNVIDAVKELQQEGKKVCFLLKDDQMISAIGYR